ncbi:iron complex outermembrane recepter protein [Leeuwenhoekiella marinoflava DSM 3653]|uniref:Iron complex outermembrane receptor protein n=3 Tax=Leeuwenhoekiella marinoflava TaxID=988 RepID=A0A4Q0PLG0_9FLAO|nr:iron complex outermembrane receptor protein [Leeuwenhoekiella marinoflava]SHF27987.1 iron complex outermembrane recepter protein [Leeuwenhoekiella marinoflava DSM 3653]
MSIRLLIGLSLMLGTKVYAQHTQHIKGNVIDASTLRPLAGVTLVGHNAYAVSDETGAFVLKTVGDSAVFKVSHLGYETLEFKPHATTASPVLLKLKSSSTALATVSVSGKTQERMHSENATVSIAVDEEFLDANRENSLMQTLNKIPGVSTMNIGSGQSKPSIRGLGFNRVSVVQNGVKHQAQQWGSDHGLEIDQYGIEEIRIIKGPASLLYGSDAIAGVVAIQPAKIPERNSFNGSVNLLTETNTDLYAVSAGMQSRGQNWFYRGRLTYRDYADFKVPTDQINYENYIFNLHNQDLRNTAGKEADASLSLGYVSPTFRTETFFSTVSAKNGFFANAHGLEVRNSSIAYDASNRDIDLPFHQVNHIKIINNSTLNLDAHRLHVDLGYQHNQREEHSEPVPHGYMPKPSGSRERVFTKNTYSLNVKDVVSWGAHTVSAGINTEFQNNNIGGWGFLIPAYDRFTLGGYVFDHMALTENLHLQGGLRYDAGYLDTQSHFDWYRSPRTNADGSTSQVYAQRARDQQLNFGSFSGSLGVSYIHKNTTYKLNIGKSFRMPLAHELASDGVNYHMYRYERGNLNLDPESSYELDAEVRHDSGRYRFSVSPFVNLFDNYIYLNPTAAYYESLQIYEYTQAAVFRAGGELTAGIDLLPNLSLDASAAYVYSRQTSGPKDGFTIPFSPPFSTLFSVGYGIKDFSLFSETRFTGDVRITARQTDIVPPESVTAGYEVLNLSVMSKLQVVSGKPWALRLKLNNVFHTPYFDHTSFYRLIEVPEPGRNFSVSVTIPF